MSFSDPDVARLLKTKFVCAWLNTNGDPDAGSSFAHAPKSAAGTCIRGNGEKNVQLLVLTPRGRIVHALSGYVGPKTLADELRFALGSIQMLEKAATPATADTDRLVERMQARIRDAQRREFSGPLSDWAKRRTLADYRFVAKRPLLEIERYDSTDFVGRGRSFFGTRRGPTEGTIGEAPENPEKMLERLRKKHGGLLPKDAQSDKDGVKSKVQPGEGAIAIATSG